MEIRGGKLFDENLLVSSGLLMEEFLLVSGHVHSSFTIYCCNS